MFKGMHLFEGKDAETNLEPKVKKEVLELQDFSTLTRITSRTAPVSSNIYSKVSMEENFWRATLAQGACNKFSCQKGS